MKQAFVKHGKVCKVYPWQKKLPDGSYVTKELPPHYCGGTRADGVVKPRHPWVEDVNDEVKPGWRWDGKKFVAPADKPIPVKSRSDMVEVFAELLGVPYEEIAQKIRDKKKARKAAHKQGGAQPEPQRKPRAIRAKRKS